MAIFPVAGSSRVHVYLAAILIGWLVGSCAFVEEEGALRVMSFNMAAGNGDLDAIAEVIRAHDPDIVALQEVDVHWGERSDGKDQARALGEALSRHSFFGEIYTLEPAAESMPPRQFGLAFLSKEPFVDQQNHRITRLTTQQEEPEPELLPGFPEVVVEIGGQRIHLFNTHLDYREDPAFRKAQVDEMLAILAEVEGPALLLGDLNAEPDDEEIRPLFERLNDAWSGQEDAGFTFPAESPIKRIDYVLHSDHFRVRTARVADTRASDHRPVIVDMELK